MRWQREPAVLWRRSGDRLVLLPPGRQVPLVVSRTGSAIWDALGHPATVEEVVASLASRFRSDGAVIHEDVTAFLEDMEADGAVRRR